jgi:hypothetical protein
MSTQLSLNGALGLENLEDLLVNIYPTTELPDHQDSSIDPAGPTLISRQEVELPQSETVALIQSSLHDHRTSHNKCPLR